jgi:hypothetical protein
MQFINAVRGNPGSTAVIGLGFLLTAQVYGATIAVQTLEAWNDCEQEARAEVLKESSTPERFLFTDSRPEHLESAQFRRGLFITSPHSGGMPIPSGLIHHWFGTISIPNAHLAELIAVLQDYNSYAAVYKPGVVESKLLGRDQNEFTYRLKFVQRGFGIKAGLLANFKSTYYRLAPDAGYSVTEAANLTELADPGTPEERPLTQNASHGYVEKVFTIVRYREVDGGVYVEVESLTLSRSIPAAIRWMVTPLVQRFSRQTMADTLDHLKNRVIETQPHIEAAASIGLN